MCHDAPWRLRLAGWLGTFLVLGAVPLASQTVDGIPFVPPTMRAALDVPPAVAAARSNLAGALARRAAAGVPAIWSLSGEASEVPRGDFGAGNISLELGREILPSGRRSGEAAIADAEVLIAGVRADLAVKVFGDDMELNRETAERVAAVLRTVPGAIQVRVEPTEGQSYLNIRLDRSQLARFGIPVRDVQEALGAAVGGHPISSLIDGSYPVEVVLQYPAAVRSSPEEIGRITIPSSAGARVALAQLADIRLEGGPVQVTREQAQRFVLVQTNVGGRDLGGFAAEVQAAVAGAVAPPPGVFITYGGEFENQARAMGRLRVVVPLSIVLIAVLLYTSLHSGMMAGLILMNLPFAAVGGVVALWLRGLNVGVSALIGFIALFGVAVLNGLVLLSTVQRERANGSDPRRAAEAGARERLRPVLMTALVASLGFLPVALSEGRGAEVQRPLATVVIGGLITSTLLTLLVLPSLYALVGRWDATPRLRGNSGSEQAKA